MYDSQKGPSTGQKGPKYPNLSVDRNPLQTVRDTYRQVQEDSYKMQPGEFMPVIQNRPVDSTGNRAIIGSTPHQVGDQNFDVRAKTFGQLDDNMHNQWVQSSVEGSEGRK